jgi:ABC-2 type transport system permease protein
MNQFNAFVKKEFAHILRDRWTTIILLVLPILMVVLFGYGISTEMKNTQFSVFDPSRDVSTQSIVNKLATSEYFTLNAYLTDPTDFENRFSQTSDGLILVFSERFAESLNEPGEAQIQLIADGSDPNSASVIVSYASNLIVGAQREMNKNVPTPALIQPEVKLLYNPSMKNAFNTVPGIMGVIIILICALMTSVSITREKEYGTMELLLVSPMKPMLIIFAKLVPYLTISIINLATILFLSHYLLEVPIAGSFTLVIFISLLYIFVSIALGLLISTLVDKQIVALLISGAGLMLPVVYLSGMMFPLESMPIVLQWFANIIPAKWFIIAMRNVMIKGLGLGSVLKEIGILSGMAIFIITLSLKRFNIRLSE